MESDVEFARWLGTRWPHRPRAGIFVPPRAIREREYDAETDQMIAFLRAERLAAEQEAQAATKGHAA